MTLASCFALRCSWASNHVSSAVLCLRVEQISHIHLASWQWVTTQLLQYRLSNERVRWSRLDRHSRSRRPITYEPQRCLHRNITTDPRSTRVSATMVPYSVDEQNMPTHNPCPRLCRCHLLHATNALIHLVYCSRCTPIHNTRASCQQSILRPAKPLAV